MVVGVEQPTLGGHAGELLRLLAEVAALEQQVAVLRLEVDRVSAEQVKRVHAVAAVGEGLADGQPMDWETLHAAVVEMTDAAFARLEGLEALLAGVDALLEATGRALLTAATRDAPCV
jgi:uncharacterized small protein (DUF1192 family)